MKVRAEVDFMIDTVKTKKGEWFELDPLIAEQFKDRKLVWYEEKPKEIRKAFNVPRSRDSEEIN